MIAIDTHRPQLDSTIDTFLQDISFQLPKDIQLYLPSEVCIACLEVMEFFSKYRRKIIHLHEFLAALVSVKLGDDTPMRKMFEEKTEQLELLFRDLDLCNRTDAGVDDLLDEYNHYAIASLDIEPVFQTDEQHDPSSDDPLFETAEELKAHKLNNAHKNYLCEICGAKLKQRSALEVHLERHMGITQFQCQYCSSSFHTRTELHNHVAAIHISEDRAECEQCGAMFTSNKLLKQHLKSHVTVRNFRCTQCERLFKTHHQLKRHIVSVHQVVRFQCDYCNTSYSRRDKLRMHVERAHQIQTYFVCEICVRSFETDEALREHRYHHEHPQLLECGTCLMVCLTQKSFDQHTCITYQEDYICCGRDFKYHMLYNKHMMMRHNIKVNARVKPKTNLLLGQERALRKSSKKQKMIKQRIYVCEQCGQRFNTAYTRRKHQCVTVATQAVANENGTKSMEGIRNIPAFNLQADKEIQLVAPMDMFD
uniref:C2H2-type domain-containing protein n=1 Tax=Anopheles farauti TaxID=69004 RepID=A0A182QIC3_9DIPT